MRLDAAATGDTRLLFCTTGILLRRLAGNPALAAVSHVVVDEARTRLRRRRVQPTFQILGADGTARPRAFSCRSVTVSVSASVTSDRFESPSAAYDLLRIFSTGQQARTRPAGLLWLRRRRAWRAGARAHASGRLPHGLAAGPSAEASCRWTAAQGAVAPPPPPPPQWHTMSYRIR